MSAEQSSIVRRFHEVLAATADREGQDPELTYKGVLYPSRLCSADTFEVLETMEAKQDDVLLVAYPKCGECLLLC